MTTTPVKGRLDPETEYDAALAYEFSFTGTYDVEADYHADNRHRTRVAALRTEIGERLSAALYDYLGPRGRHNVDIEILSPFYSSTKKTVEDGEHKVRVTVDGFNRDSTNHYPDATASQTLRAHKGAVRDEIEAAISYTFTSYKLAKRAVKFTDANLYIA